MFNRSMCVGFRGRLSLQSSVPDCWVLRFRCIPLGTLKRIQRFVQPSRPAITSLGPQLNASAIRGEKQSMQATSFHIITGLGVVKCSV
jgi:hypothetical protein